MERRRVHRGEAGFVVVACLLGALTGTVHGETSAPRRGDAKAYRFLNDTKRLPKLDGGDADRTLAFIHWQPLPRRVDDPALSEPVQRLQVLDATCDADLVVIARVDSSVPFQHPNGRWALTAHDLAVSRVVRTKAVTVQAIEPIRYVHPSGQLTIAGRAVRTTVYRFPMIESDEEALFFLVRIGGGTYRTSLVLPPMALRGGILDAFGIVSADAAREQAAGLSTREALRLAAGAVCRPPEIERPTQRPWPRPTSPRDLPSPPGVYRP